eukprot:m.14184 g.14184  ORF g.14184 m.14184 type:complete len:484 (+) comp10036_c0_seq1:364-1815(+)
MSRLLQHDDALKWVAVGTLFVYAIASRDLLLASCAAAVGVLDLQVIVLWGCFAGGLVAAVLSILTGLALLLPLQFFPANKVEDKKTNKIRMIVLGSLWTMFIWIRTDTFGWFLRSVSLILSLLLVIILGYMAMRLREFFAENVIGSLVLPAINANKMDVMLPNGQKCKAKQAIVHIRASSFNTIDLESNQSKGVASWTNAKLPGSDGVRIDGAYYINELQSQLPAEEQRWILWFLGNGEVYEMMLQDFEGISNTSGMNIYVFNYRGVSHSEGQLVQAWDLVEDGRVCLSHITSVLSARPEHVLLFGHSIGGAVAAQLRAEHSPQGPLVVDRSFCNLGAAANSVFGMISKAIIGSEVPIPKFVIVGLLSSVFKGRMDAKAAWLNCTGPRLTLYHTQDLIIKYSSCSLHAALDTAGQISDTEFVKLGLEGEGGGGNHHNLPLERFPEYKAILTKMRNMVGLPAEVPHVRLPRRETHTRPDLNGSF